MMLIVGKGEDPAGRLQLWKAPSQTRQVRRSLRLEQADEGCCRQRGQPHRRLSAQDPRGAVQPARCPWESLGGFAFQSRQVRFLQLREFRLRLSRVTTASASLEQVRRDSFGTSRTAPASPSPTSSSTLSLGMYSSLPSPPPPPPSAPFSHLPPPPPPPRPPRRLPAPPPPPRSRSRARRKRSRPCSPPAAQYRSRFDLRI